MSSLYACLVDHQRSLSDSTGLALCGVALLQRDQPERFRQLLDGEWVQPMRAGSGVEGTLMGQPLTAERVF